MTTFPLYSLSISARLTLDMHSLNNEGGEGNQIQTRMVNIVDQDGKLQYVNAISGDMYKHIQAEHLFNLAKANPALPLCAGCREFNANRINADAEFFQRTANLKNAAVLDELLKTCAMDDIEGILITEEKRSRQDGPGQTDSGQIEGILITEGKRSLPRKSVIEFGWVVGIPGSVETDSYFHVKYATSDRSQSAKSRAAEESSGANLKQAIFHRPASSGIYAAVCHLELARIGFNDITQQYAIGPEERQARAKALLESVLYTFLQPNGAMRSSQSPHLVNLEGVVSISSGATPAPTMSPLKDSYREKIEELAGSLGKIAPGVLDVSRFNSPGELAEVLGNLITNTAPYALA